MKKKKTSDAPGSALPPFDPVMDARVASPTDHTGYAPTVPMTEDEAEHLSSLMNVPTADKHKTPAT